MSAPGSLPAAWLAVALLLLAALAGCEARERSSRIAPHAAEDLRVVSINPSLTSILLALGARDALVGIDDFSAAQQPDVADLPRVGGLFSPSLEAVAALEPDAVVLVPSVEQRDFRKRLSEIGIPVIVFENIRLEQVLHNIEALGELVDRQAEAAARVRTIEATGAAARQVTANRARPRTVLVLQRDPVFIVGRGGFIDELLALAGAENLGAHFEEPYPQVAVEWLVDAEPEVLIDLTPDSGDPMDFWSRWPAIPAVSARRVLHLDPQMVTLPGPHLDRSLRALLTVLHGTSATAELNALLEQRAARTGRSG